MLHSLKYLTLIIAFFTLLNFYGCEKETGDVIIAEINNPFEGNYIFSITSDLTGHKEIAINNRGSFSFFIQLYSSGSSDPFAIIITGIVDDNGNVSGKIYKSQYEIGTLNGQLGYGDFSFDYNGYAVQGSYAMAGSN